MRGTPLRYGVVFISCLASHNTRMGYPQKGGHLLSTYAIEAMGFKDLVAPGSIKASFTSITVFEARGITVAEGITETTGGRAAGVEYRVAISGSVNAACYALAGDNFEESEDAWRAEVKSSGPFALVAVGPTAMIACTAGRSMRAPDGTIGTYDCFPEVRRELESMEQRLMPPVVSALTCALSTSDRHVLLKKLARVSAGRTPDLTTVQDFRVEVRAEGYVSRTVSRNDLAEALQSISQRASDLNERAAAFFALGVGEVDQLKKFLYFFLSLEVETHAVFGRIDHAAKVQSTFVLNQTAHLALRTVLERQVSGLTNLFNRFVWCAACRWTHLTDGDVDTFRRLKNARDAIAHGRASEPPEGYAKNAELLAHKILWC